jgi:hypothetical protein
MAAVYAPRSRLSLISFAATTESLGNVGGDGYGGAAQLQRQPVRLLPGETCSEGVNSQHELVRAGLDMAIEREASTAVCSWYLTTQECCHERLRRASQE